MSEPSAVILFSGGIASWAAARRYVDDHGTSSGAVLLFSDTKTEDPDLYRFLDEAAADIGAPLVTISDGRDIWQVFRDERMLGNSRVDPCSRILKRDLTRKWLEEHAPRAALVFGYDYTEVHRHERTAARWAPRRVVSPLIAPPYRVRSEWMTDLAERGISPPRLYGLGFAHNNCGGGCVKAGIGHFTHLLEVLPDVFAEWEGKERELRADLGDVSILRDRSGGTFAPLPLSTLRERIEAGTLGHESLWDIGGCDCFGEPAA